LAEDFDDTRALVERALAAHGVEVKAVAGGEQAVVEGAAASYDLVLMDLRMPGMDGITATRELRRRGCLAPIIAMTASISAGDRDALMRAGFDDVWAKPMTLESLVERTAAYLPAATDAATAAAPLFVLPPVRTEVHKDQLVAMSVHFAEKLPLRMADLAEAVQSGRTGEAYEILHQLIGSCGIHGFMDLSKEAARLLVLARAGRLAGRTGELQAMNELVRQALASPTDTIRAKGGD
jgi:CheY-like chemotaxis protein